MSDFENAATIEIMNIKTNIENGEVFSKSTLDLLLGTLMSTIKEMKILEKQLDYALENGGKYLDVKDNFN